jgi:hypothetical protein
MADKILPFHPQAKNGLFFPLPGIPKQSFISGTSCATTRAMVGVIGAARLKRKGRQRLSNFHQKIVE